MSPLPQTSPSRLTLLLTLITLLSLSSAYIIELEIDGRKKRCVSEIFKKNEPISMRAIVTAANNNEFSVYLTIETMNHKLLTHKKYESSNSSTVLTFNNDADQQLNLCVDNFEQYIMTIELEIKFGVHLGDTDVTPTKNVGIYMSE